MKVFLTGASGFVGRALSHHLHNEGHEIVALVRDADERLTELGMTTQVFGDIRDYKRLREILLDYKPDAILHLAAQAIVAQAHRDPYTTFDINVNGTTNVLSAYRDSLPDAYFLYFSTDKVYGNGMDKKETDVVQASGIYETSKAAADLIVQSNLNHNVAITRTCNIYGPNDRNKRIIPNTVQACARGETVIIYAKAGKREYIYIDDLCTIIHKLLSDGKRGIWNIGSGQLLSNEQVVKEICKHYPNIKPKYAKSPPWLELEDQSLNTEKLCSNIDCLAFTRFEEGIKRTVNFWKEETASHTAKPVIMNA